MYRTLIQNILTCAVLIVLAACGSDTLTKNLSLQYTNYVERKKINKHLIDASQQGARFYVQLKITAQQSSQTNTRFKENPGVLSGGSGTLISHEHIVTAAHIAVDKSNNAIVQLLSGVNTSGKVIALDHSQDLALIKLDEKLNLPGQTFISHTPVANQQPVLTIGTPGQRAGNVSSGHVISDSIPKVIKYNEYSVANPIHLAMRIDAGFSGGPVCDYDGNLVGMIVSMDLKRNQKGQYVNMNRAYAVSTRTIINFYERYRQEN